MKKTFFFLFAFLPLVAWAQFDQYFTEASLRVDYCLTGNHDETTFSLKELIREPYWSGSKTNLIDNLEFGSYIVKVYEAGTEHLLFSKGYQNLYGEWQTTDEARRVTKTFEESVIVPFPKVKVDVVLYRKTWEGELKYGMSLSVSPEYYFISSYCLRATRRLRWASSSRTAISSWRACSTMRPTTVTARASTSVG